jgi:hypothetical protein
MLTIGKRLYKTNTCRSREQMNEGAQCLYSADCTIRQFGETRQRKRGTGVEDTENKGSKERKRRLTTKERP